MLAAAAAATVPATLSTHLLVVGLMLRQYLLPHFFLSFVDIRVEFVTVFFNRELLVIVDRNEDFFRAVRFLFRVMELGYIRVL